MLVTWKMAMQHMLKKTSLFSPYERSHFSEGKYFGLFFEVQTMPPYETRDLNIGKASEFLLVFIEAE